MKELRLIIVMIFIAIFSNISAQDTLNDSLYVLKNKLLSSLKMAESFSVGIIVSHKDVNNGQPFLAGMYLPNTTNKYHKQVIDSIYIEGDSLYLRYNAYQYQFASYNDDSRNIHIKSKKWIIPGGIFSMFLFHQNQYPSISSVGPIGLDIGDERGYLTKISGNKVLLNEIAGIWNNMKSVYRTIELNKLLKEFYVKIDERKSHDEKTGITEEQRRLIVQANAANDEKNYGLALKYYEKVIALNAFSYPPAYFNMALINERLNRYEHAIYNMKKYLILSPDNEDSRKGQDKIYEWEYQIKKFIKE